MAFAGHVEQQAVQRGSEYTQYGRIATVQAKVSPPVSLSDIVRQYSEGPLRHELLARTAGDLINEMDHAWKITGKLP